MFKLIQEYSTESSEDMYAYNQFTRCDSCEIKIFLGSLMDRKNMAFDKLVKKINSFFLLEFVCAFMGSQQIWSENLCENGHICRIKQALKKADYFLW